MVEPKFKSRSSDYWYPPKVVIDIFRSPSRNQDIVFEFGETSQKSWLVEGNQVKPGNKTSGAK